MRIYAALLLIVAAGAVLWWAGLPGNRGVPHDTPGGVIAGSVGISAHAIMADGSVDLYRAGIAEIEHVPIDYGKVAASSGRDRGRLLLIRGVRLIIGEMGAIDMRDLGVEVTCCSETESLALARTPPLRTGEWIIAGKSGTTPFSRADNDTLLEPAEQFDLLLFPQAPVSPGDRIEIRLLPPGSVPYSLTCVVPPW